MTQPTVSKHWRTIVGQSTRKGPIPPGQALYKVKWSKYNFFKHLLSTTKSEDTEVLGELRARPNEIKAWSSRQTWKNCSLWLCNVHCLNATQYYSTETVLLIFPSLQTNITVQMRPNGGWGGVEKESRRQKCMETGQIARERNCRKPAVLKKTNRSQVRVPAAPLHNDPGQVVHTYVPLFTKQYKFNWYQPMGGDAPWLGR